MIDVIMHDHTASPEALYGVIRLVRPLYKALEAAVERELAGTGISVTQRAVLERLLADGPQAVPALGRRLIAPRQFVQKVANELIDRGLVERQANAAHRRSMLLALTAEGQAAIARILAREAEVMRPIARGLDPADLDTTRAVMTAMIARFRSPQPNGDQT